MTEHLNSRTRWLALLMLCLGRPDDRARHEGRERRAAVDPGRPAASRETSLAWVVNAYMLTFGGFLLLGGRLGDLFGHRRVFLGRHRRRSPRASLACGVSPDAGAPGRGARRAGARRCGRLGRRAVADHGAVHRARPSARRRWASSAS